MVFITLLLALGAHTPLFGILYAYLPGFGSFRGTAKFIFYAELFMIMLALQGWEQIPMPAKEKGKGEDGAPSSSTATGGVKTVRIILILALIASGCGVLLLFIADGRISPQLWQGLLQFIGASGEAYIEGALFSNEGFIRYTALHGARQWFIVAFLFLVTGVLWRLSCRGMSYARGAIAILAILEVFTFARICVTSFDPLQVVPPPLKSFARQLDPEARVLNLWRPNASLGLRLYDLWGNDPTVPRRYGELIAATQGQDRRNATQYAVFRQYHPLFRMLRLRYLMVPGDGGLRILELPSGMAHLQLLAQWQVEKVPERILQIIMSRDFDPDRTVVLEEIPPIAPSPVIGENRAHIVSSSPSSMVIEAQLTSPHVLLITDNYAAGWQIASLGAAFHHYRLLRANYTLMAIPLPAGSHQLRLFYRPRLFWWGLTVTVIAGIIHVAVFLIARRRRRQIWGTQGKDFLL